MINSKDLKQAFRAIAHAWRYIRKIETIEDMVSRVDRSTEVALSTFKMIAETLTNSSNQLDEVSQQAYAQATTLKQAAEDQTQIAVELQGKAKKFERIAQNIKKIFEEA